MDEAHHAAVLPDYHMLSQFNSGIKNLDSVSAALKIVASLAVSPTEHSVPIIGFSATFSRHDGSCRFQILAGLTSCIQPKTNGRTNVLTRLSSMLTWVSWQVMQRAIHARPGRHKVAVTSAMGDYNPTSLASVISTEPLNSSVVQA